MPWRCEFCEGFFNSLTVLEKHIEDSHAEELLDRSSFKCNICEKHFIWQYELERHLKSQHRPPVVKCKQCGKKLRSSGIQRHLEIHQRGLSKIWVCPACGVFFSSLLELTAHAKTHGDKGRLYPCDVCGKRYKSKTNLQAHMQTHSDSWRKERTCEICGEYFIRILSLKSHLKVHGVVENTAKRSVSGGEVADKEQVVTQCEVCGKIMKSSNFREHQLGHSEDRPFHCNQCGRSFSKRSLLSNHRQSHSLERPFQCEVCGKRSKLYSTHKRHMTIHEKEKRFKCSVCEKGFHRKKGLDRHVLTHTNEKPYSCNFCHRTFSQNSARKVHLRVHTKERPYTCDCGKSFSHKVSMTRYHRCPLKQNGGSGDIQ